MEYYSESEKGFIIPGIEIQYIYDRGYKYLRFVSEILDIRFIQAISTGKIRAQVWLEKNIRKGSNGVIKHSWVHSYDNTPNAPMKLFTNKEYNYGGRQGWGIATGARPPEYSTTRGFVPTEFEITEQNIVEKRIIVKIDLSHIFANAICRKEVIYLEDGSGYYYQNSSVPNGEPSSNICFIGKNRRAKYPIRARVMVNSQSQVLSGESSSPIYLGIKRYEFGTETIFNTEWTNSLATVTKK